MGSFLNCFGVLAHYLVVGKILAGGIWDYLLLAIFSLTQGYLAAMLGAIAAAKGRLDPWLVFLSVSSTHIVADNVWYLLGRALEMEKVIRVGQSIGLNNKDMLDIVEGIKAYGSKILFLSKLTSGMTIPALLASGMVRIKWEKAFLIIAIGEAIRTGTIVLVGYRLTLSVKRLEFWTQVVAILGGILVFWISIRAIRRFAKRASSPTMGKRP